MQLLKMITENNMENHPSRTGDDAEQESGGVFRKQFDLFIFYEFLKYVYKGNLNSIVLTLVCNY